MQANTRNMSPTQTSALHEILEAGARGLSERSLKSAGITAGTIQALRRRGLVAWDERELATGATIHVLRATV